MRPSSLCANMLRGDIIANQLTLDGGTEPIKTPSHWPANMITPMSRASSSAGRSVAQLPPESTTAPRC